MIIVRVPFRVSLFGGSTDYESFYKHHGSFLIGGTIDKYIYLSMRYRPKLLSEKSLVVYSKMEEVRDFDEITNPLIREILKFRNISKTVEFHSFSDIRARTGLGGSSSYCVGLLYLLDQLTNSVIAKKQLVRDAIHVERYILKESGGIQDQIWPVYGGLNTIEITNEGNFFVKPLSLSEDFVKEFESNLLLIYTGKQRDCGSVADSHDGKDKIAILQLAKEAHGSLLKENIEKIGSLVYQSWKEKLNISNLISTSEVDAIIDHVMSRGAYGAKLLGAGGCGFVVCVCNPKLKQEFSEYFNGKTLDFEFENKGVTRIY
ncbi:hypothetical protein C4577_01870 [Candidatus Parcubacteria bacterium]|nr:MAG: hypothetical protein C4577_01870 [Candidatus Parcubacteria bacterium]